MSLKEIKKKKIGILTFHWGTNYGGVLQSYALQRFLESNGYDVEIINYAPHTFRDVFYKCFYSKNPFTIIDNLKNYWKEKNIRKFRKKHLAQTKRYYYPEQLIEKPPLMDVYIAGSDQVWNPYGLEYNKKIYFLPFGNDKSIKLSYSASFGVLEYPDSLLEEIKPLLKKFEAISVRENSGIDILKKAGIDNCKLLPDPTFLLEGKDYIEIINKVELFKKYDYFFYVLQKKQKLIGQIYELLKKNKNNEIIHSNKVPYSVMGIEKWLYYMKNSKCVITNSFHGAVFSIIFNKPFILIPIEGRLLGMNDRITTLMENFGLNDRIIWEFDERVIRNTLSSHIEWMEVNNIRKKALNSASCFFRNTLKK